MCRLCVARSHEAPYAGVSGSVRLHGPAPQASSPFVDALAFVSFCRLLDARRPEDLPPKAIALDKVMVTHVARVRAPLLRFTLSSRMVEDVALADLVQAAGGRHGWAEHHVGVDPSPDADARPLRLFGVRPTLDPEAQSALMDACEARGLVFEETPAGLAALRPARDAGIVIDPHGALVVARSRSMPCEAVAGLKNTVDWVVDLAAQLGDRWAITHLSEAYSETSSFDIRLSALVPPDARGVAYDVLARFAAQLGLAVVPDGFRDDGHEPRSRVRVQLDPEGGLTLTLHRHG